MRISAKVYNIKVSIDMIDGYYKYLNIHRDFIDQCYIEREVYKVIYKKLNL